MLFQGLYAYSRKVDKMSEHKRQVWTQHAFFKKCVAAHKTSTGKNQEDVATDLGLATTSLNNLVYQKKGKEYRRPSFETAKKAAELFACSVTQFLDDPGIATLATKSDEVLVPWCFPQLSAECDGVAGGSDRSKTVGVPFNKAWLIHTLNVAPANAAMFTIEGDSMEPVLNSGDYVLVNKGARLAGFQDGIWLIRAGDAIMVKKVQVVGPGQLQAVSLNPAYPSFMLDGDFELIGRVVHRSGRI